MGWASEVDLLWVFFSFRTPASPSGDLSPSQWHQPGSLLRNLVLAEWFSEELQNIPWDAVSSSCGCSGIADSRELADPAPSGKSLLD